MNCKTRVCKKKATHIVMWPGEGALYYCSVCVRKAGMVIRAMGQIPKMKRITKHDNSQF
jgi:hypothetical protein